MGRVYCLALGHAFFPVEYTCAQRMRRLLFFMAGTCRSLSTAGRYRSSPPRHLSSNLPSIRLSHFAPIRVDLHRFFAQGPDLTRPAASVDRVLDHVDPSLDCNWPDLSTGPARPYSPAPLELDLHWDIQVSRRQPRCSTLASIVSTMVPTVQYILRE